MREFFHSKFFIFLAFALVICLVLLTVTTVFSNGQVSVFDNLLGVLITPIQRGISSVSGFFGNIYARIAAFDELQEENLRLHAQLSEMDKSLRDAQVALDDNVRLRELLGLKQKNRSYEFEMAEIIAFNSGNWGVTFTIDRGSVSGVELSNAVITETGFVGYVSEVGLNFSKVTTLLDPSTQLGAIISRSREIAVAEGNFQLMNYGVLRLSFLKKEADIIVGDTVETSGLGGVYPKGLVIGTVEQILPEESGMSNYAVLRPAVELSRVKKVFVVKHFEITE